MNIVDNSLAIVLLGDWNKLYVQPDWVATNIFCKSEMEIGVDAQGIDINVSYKCDNIIINPSQEKVVLTATNIKPETIDFLAKCANNYITKAKTPFLAAYGLNIDFIETDNTLLPDMFDNVSDSQVLSRLNYAIVNSQMNRTIEKDDKTINIQYNQEQNYSKIHLNEHHSEPDISSIVFDYERVVDFIGYSKDIVTSLGYDIEDIDNE
ncbi:MAG: hypothetical protein IJ262_02100 [Clostridia bacterium]|nr:hypothetical protein [Clostridia bacterium]